MQAGIGQFLTYDQIVQKQAPQFTELLRGMRAVRLVRRPREFGTSLLGTRTGKGAPICVSLVIDGVPQVLQNEYSAAGTLVGSESPDNFLDVSNVGAIEVYDTSERPAGFGNDFCALVVVWTRTRLGLLSGGVPPDTIHSNDVIHGLADFPGDTPCTPPAPSDTAAFGVFATLREVPAVRGSTQAWRAYKDSVVASIGRWVVLPSEILLPAFGAPFARPGARKAGDNRAVAPTLSAVVVFTLDSAGALTAAHIAASSLSGAVDTSLLAGLARAASANAFPRLPSNANRPVVRFDLAVSSVGVPGDAPGALLGRLEVPVWRLSREAVRRPPVTSADSAGSDLSGTEGLAFQAVIDADGRLVGRTVRLVSGPASDSLVARDGHYGVRVAQALERFRFEPAMIGSCPVSQLVVQPLSASHQATDTR